MRPDFRHRVEHSSLVYHLWWMTATTAFAAANIAAIVGEWGWALGFTVGTLAASAHARLERMDGHRHHSSDIEVP